MRKYNSERKKYQSKISKEKKEKKIISMKK